MEEKFNLKPGQLQLNDLRMLCKSQLPVQLDKDCLSNIEKSQQAVQDVIAAGKTVYGVNTGFGRLANQHINDEQLQKLQRNLVLSHCCGTGPLVSDDVVRIMLLLKINSLAQGYSGITQQIIDSLLALHNQQVYPCIPSQGSVGASGDLAPLAHLTAPLLGEGELRHDGECMPAAKGLAVAGLKPQEFPAKTGLAMINGLQASTAHALEGLFMAENIWHSAIVAGAMSVDAAAGSAAPFDPRLHTLRNNPQQQKAAAELLRLLNNSEIMQSHIECGRVQDPYSLRCQPQVMGACLSHIEFAGERFLAEANAVSDNPVVFAEQQDIISGGNFHGQAIAMAADSLAIAIAEIGALSERRIALLMDEQLSGLPAFLVNESGLNSGFMIAQVTAAALASENKSLAHPASVDSLPTSANQEDHVSMANYAARRLRQMCENSAVIVAIELLAACQGLDLRLPLKSSDSLEKVKAEIRSKVKFYEQDRAFAEDIEFVKQMVLEGIAV